MKNLYKKKRVINTTINFRNYDFKALKNVLSNDVKQLLWNKRNFME